jgi:hypothetical protein
VELPIVSEVGTSPIAFDECSLEEKEVRLNRGFVLVLNVIGVNTVGLAFNRRGGVAVEVEFASRGTEAREIPELPVDEDRGS